MSEQFAFVLHTPVYYILIYGTEPEMVGCFIGLTQGLAPSYSHHPQSVFSFQVLVIFVTAY
jgi:hypothetical protein